MSYVILDLEWNYSFSSALDRYVNEIIEFGAVRVDDEFNITDTFSMLIKPQISKKLRSKIKELTKITNEELFSNGVPFLEAVNRFTEFCGDSILMTWSTSDLHTLIENYSYFTGDNKLPFLKRYCNLQAFCEGCLGKNEGGSSQLGLSACAELLGISFSSEEQHRAFADAELSLKCFEKLFDKKPLAGYISDARNPAFYERLTFKNHYITDINSDEIDRKQMGFCCDVCGKRARKTTKWKLKNKSFVANFTCRNCGRQFIGKVAFKKKYTGVEVKKKIYVPAEKTEQETETNVKV